MSVGKVDRAELRNPEEDDIEAHPLEGVIVLSPEERVLAL